MWIRRGGGSSAVAIPFEGHFWRERHQRLLIEYKQNFPLQQINTINVFQVFLLLRGFCKYYLDVLFTFCSCRGSLQILYLQGLLLKPVEEEGRMRNSFVVICWVNLVTWAKGWETFL